MKKWKIIKILTIAILCIFAIYASWRAIVCYNSNETYPHEALGVIQINNWIDAFCLEIMLSLYIVGIPLIIDIIFMIVSVIKIRKYQ